MAVSKKDVLANNSVVINKAVAEAESVIDSMLSNYVEGSNIAISVSLLRIPRQDDFAFERKVLEAIKQLYEREEKGWTVSIESDQRSDSWLDFS